MKMYRSFERSGPLPEYFQQALMDITFKQANEGIKN